MSFDATFNNHGAKVIKRIVTLFGVLVAGVLSMTLIAPSAAQAAAYTKGVYAPEVNGTQITGWADVSTDCEDTLGCYTYVKLEYRPELADWAHLPTFADQGQWRDAAGHWASDGWNSVETDFSSLPTVPAGTGCGYIRTTALTYNDMVAGPPVDVGISVWIVETSLGDSLRRFESVNSSEEVRVCPNVA